MKRTIIYSALLLATISTLLSFDIPKGWFIAGSQPGKYDMGIDKGAGVNGKNAATIKSIDGKTGGFGTLMQTCATGKYLGKRVRMTGMMKTANVKKWAGFWFRVDKKGSKKSLSFDNMHRKHIHGSTDWQQYEIVLDVPENASNLAYGALLVGTGQIWFDNINFEIVGDSVKTTGH